MRQFVAGPPDALPSYFHTQMRGFSDKRRFAGIIGGLLVVWLIQAIAQAPPTGLLRVEVAWSRATPPGATVGGAYLQIVNDGPPDRLISLMSPVARSVEMHEMLMKGTLMEMRPVQSVPVPARGRVRFEPGGLHVMLIDLKQPLKEGERFPLKLRFARAGDLTIDVVVRGLGDPGPGERTSQP